MVALKLIVFGGRLYQGHTQLPDTYIGASQGASLILFPGSVGSLGTLFMGGGGLLQLTNPSITPATYSGQSA